ncbi:MAG: hypothetical protein ACRDRI_18160 [Pseudonocardiaceae bacterium]
MSSLDLRVAGDVRSCRDTATQLRSLSAGIIDASTSFHRARTESETLWLGQGGDAFRDRMSPIATSTDQIADRTREVSQGLHAFADDLSTVHSRMDQARQVATAAGLTVNGDSIEAPQEPDHPVGFIGPVAVPADDPRYAATITTYQAQSAAYAEAAQTVSEARAIETAAHDDLQRKFTSWGTVVEDIKDQWYWLAAGNTTGPVGAALAEANKWSTISAARARQLDVFKRIAAEAKDPFEEAAAARAVGVFEKSETAALNAAKSNAKVGLGLSGTKLGGVLASDARIFFSKGSALAEVGKKIPLVGLGLACGQFVGDAIHATDGGEVAKAAAADLGGFAAGNGATAGVLAGAAAFGLAGGPVTLAAVGVGAGVSYGVGYAVKNWGEISNDAGAATDAMGHAADATGNAIAHGAKAVGHGVGHAASSASHFLRDIL